MTYTFDGNIVSDLHKDAFGFRPNQYFWEEWNQSPDAAKQVIWDDLLVALDRAIEFEKQEQAANIAAFERGVEAALLLGATDRAAAIRWVVQGLELDEVDLQYGGSKVCYELGLPYDMQTVFDPICKDLLGDRAPLVVE